MFPLPGIFEREIVWWGQFSRLKKSKLGKKEPRAPPYNFSFKNTPIPKKLNIRDIRFVPYMKASSKRDQNITTARIGDRVTQINQIRTENITRDQFDVEGLSVTKFSFFLLQL